MKEEQVKREKIEKTSKMGAMALECVESVELLSRCAVVERLEGSVHERGASKKRRDRKDE